MRRYVLETFRRWFITTRRCVRAAYAVAVCLLIWLFVRLSVTHKSVCGRQDLCNGRVSVRPSASLIRRSRTAVMINWYLAWSFLSPFLHYVIRKFGYLQKGYFPLEFCPKLWLRKFHHGMSIVCHHKKLSYRRGTARCVVSIEILPIATQQCRNYLYDKSLPNRWHEVGDLVGDNAW